MPKDGVKKKKKKRGGKRGMVAHFYCFKTIYKPVVVAEWAYERLKIQVAEKRPSIPNITMCK